ncbi:MAG: hypothetical protein BIFFINMI_00924 [Phycisphaerae bacterium]|nr:hypothetical protein [Phycisphaerae bacterium]
MIHILLLVTVHSNQGLKIKQEPHRLGQIATLVAISKVEYESGIPECRIQGGEFLNSLGNLP